MNTVTFPGLGLSFELNRVAFCLGDFCIYWYGIIIGLGFLLGGGFCCWRAKDFGLKGDDILDLLLFAAPGGIIGAHMAVSHGNAFIRKVFLVVLGILVVKLGWDTVVAFVQ